jgi:PadR family transcriptional regulator AphA
VGAPKFRNELLLKVFFGSKAEPGAIAAHVRARRERYVASLARYDGIAEHIASMEGDPNAPFYLMTVRYGIAEVKALIGWCDETLAVLEQQDAEVEDKN